MSCKYFRIEDALRGYCREKKSQNAAESDSRPMVRHDDSCKKWEDCGQQYYIRLGWLRAFNARNEEKNNH